MLSMYKWQQVKVLGKQGMPVKEIARRLKISKNTVKKYLRSSSPPVFKVREYEKVLDKYGDEIREMSDKKYIGTRIFNELCAKGYEGSLSAVHRHLQKTREDKTIREKATTRFETVPGKQMQYDWTEWDLSVGDHAVRVYCHEVVLGYSRRKHYSWSLRIKTQDVMRAIERSILDFGGVPEELVIDNPKQMVITHRKNGVVCYRDDFLKFCGIYGITPNACEPYRARTKGKVERPFYYLKEHLLKGLKVEELSELDAILSNFADRYNARLHSSLKESPDERFVREQEHLRGIPAVEPSWLYERAPRKVSNDGYLSWDGGLYPVPMECCLRDVLVEEVFGYGIKVYDLSGRMIADHRVRLFDKRSRPEHPEHGAMNASYHRKKESYRSHLIRTFMDLFPDQGKLYVAGLRRDVKENLAWHLEEILSFRSLYSINEMSAVLAECIRLGSYHKNTVRRLLGEREPVIFLPELVSATPGWTRIDITRPLSEYHVEVAHA